MNFSQVSLSAERLAKLSAVHSPLFADLVEKIRKVGRAGYQEGLVEKLALDMKGLVYGITEVSQKKVSTS